MFGTGKLAEDGTPDALLNASGGELHSLFAAAPARLQAPQLTRPHPNPLKKPNPGARARTLHPHPDPTTRL